MPKGGGRGGGGSGNGGLGEGDLDSLLGGLFASVGGMSFLPRFASASWMPLGTTVSSCWA
jgi:hypothetical protein